MKNQDINILNKMRLDGKKASEIACALRISVNTVRSYIRRHPDIQGRSVCRNCGKVIVQPSGHKIKLFCSDKCRMAWWNSHPEKINKKAYYNLICNQCGKEFISYGNKNRKFCCRECYLKSRKFVSGGEIDTLSNGAGPNGQPAS